MPYDTKKEETGLRQRVKIIDFQGNAWNIIVPYPSPISDPIIIIIMIFLELDI